jgi:acetyl-CoA carboxylase carboxyltransferase component
MDKKSSLTELADKMNSAQLGGGTEKIEAQHKLGKMTARERVRILLDDASFIELDKFYERSQSTTGFESVTAAGEGVITGYGTVDGRPIYVYAQDYTVLNGSMSCAQAQKIVKIMDMALQNGAPVIGILDSGGARISEGAAAMGAYGALVKKMTDISGVVPTVCVVAGPCIGAAAVIAGLSDFTFAVDKAAVLLMHGQQIVSSSMGEAFKVDNISGAQAMNERTGTAQFFSANENEAYAVVRRLLSYLPSNNLDEAPSQMAEDDLNRQIPELDAYDLDARDLIIKIADNNDFLEYHAHYAKEAVTGFARMNGNTVGFIATRGTETLTGAAAKKAARFIMILDAYHIPVILIVDSGDIPVQDEIQNENMISDISGLLYALAQATVPMVAVITGQAVAAGLLAVKSANADIVLAWSSAVISALPEEAGALIQYEKEITSADDPISARSAAIEKYKTEYANAFTAARLGVVDDVIAPSATRQMVIGALEACITKRQSKPPKKHGVLPL